MHHCRTCHAARTPTTWSGDVLRSHVIMGAICGVGKRKVTEEDVTAVTPAGTPLPVRHDVPDHIPDATGAGHGDLDGGEGGTIGSTTLNEAADEIPRAKGPVEKSEVLKWVYRVTPHVPILGRNAPPVSLAVLDDATTLLKDLDFEPDVNEYKVLRMYKAYCELATSPFYDDTPISERRDDVVPASPYHPLTPVLVPCTDMAKGDYLSPFPSRHASPFRGRSPVDATGSDDATERAINDQVLKDGTTDGGDDLSVHTDKTGRGKVSESEQLVWKVKVPTIDDFVDTSKASKEQELFALKLKQRLHGAYHMYRVWYSIAKAATLAFGHMAHTLPGGLSVAPSRTASPVPGAHPSPKKANVTSLFENVTKLDTDDQRLLDNILGRSMHFSFMMYVAVTAIFLKPVLLKTPRSSSNLLNTPYSGAGRFTSLPSARGDRLFSPGVNPAEYGSVLRILGDSKESVGVSDADGFMSPGRDESVFAAHNIGLRASAFGGMSDSLAKDLSAVAPMVSVLESSMLAQPMLNGIGSPVASDSTPPPRSSHAGIVSPDRMETMTPLRSEPPPSGLMTPSSGAGVSDAIGGRVSLSEKYGSPQYRRVSTSPLPAGGDPGSPGGASMLGGIGGSGASLAMMSTGNAVGIGTRKVGSLGVGSTSPLGKYHQMAPISDGFSNDDTVGRMRRRTDLLQGTGVSGGKIGVQLLHARSLFTFRVLREYATLMLEDVQEEAGEDEGPFGLAFESIIMLLRGVRTSIRTEAKALNRLTPAQRAQLSTTGAGCKLPYTTVNVPPNTVLQKAGCVYDVDNDLVPSSLRSEVERVGAEAETKGKLKRRLEHERIRVMVASLFAVANKNPQEDLLAMSDLAWLA